MQHLTDLAVIDGADDPQLDTKTMRAMTVEWLALEGYRPVVDEDGDVVCTVEDITVMIPFDSMELGDGFYAAYALFGRIEDAEPIVLAAGAIVQSHVKCVVIGEQFGFFALGVEGYHRTLAEFHANLPHTLAAIATARSDMPRVIAKLKGLR